MSHFAVLVITKSDPLQGGLLEKVMAPYHEYECTGDDNKYVQDIDITEQARKKYDEYTYTCFVDPQGKPHQKYSDEFKVKAVSGDIMARDTYVCPPAWTEEEIPANKLETFREFVGSYYSYTAVKHGYKPNLKGDQKYGYMLLDEQGEVMKVIDRTNPNAKWDWYQVGGRYLGRLLVKPNARGRVGKSGAFSNKPLHQDGVDSCRWGDVDLDRMRDEAEARAAADYDSIAAVVKGRTFKSWPEVRREFGCLDGDHVNWPEGAMEKARDAYHEQEVIKELSSHKDLFRWDGYEEYRQPREEFLAKARERALSSFAVITEDGKWYERGEMGWWGIVRDEKDVDTWDREFAKLLDNLTPDHYVTYVDCHI